MGWKMKYHIIEMWMVRGKKNKKLISESYSAKQSILSRR